MKVWTSSPADITTFAIKITSFYRMICYYIYFAKMSIAREITIIMIDINISCALQS